MRADYPEAILGMVIHELPKSSLPAGTATSGGRYPFFCSSPIVTTTDRAIFAGEAIIMGTGGDATVHHGVGEFSYSTDTWAFRSSSEEVLTTYLWRWLEYRLPWVSYRCFQGTGLKHLQKQDVRAAPLPLPLKGEQCRIATVIDVIDEAIVQMEALVAKLKHLRTGLLHDLLTLGLDQHGHLRDPIRHPEQFQGSIFGHIPRDWSVRSIDNICTDIVDCKNRTPPYTSAGYPVVRTSNVRDGELLTDDMLFTSSDGYREWTRRRVPQAGDLMITREAPVGQACLVPPNMQLCLGQRMMLYVFDIREMSSSFFLYVVLSEVMQRRFEAVSDGSTVRHVRLEDMRNFPVPVPHVDEQRAIAKVMADQDATIKATERQLAKVHQLKSGLVADLLSGRVRVPGEVMTTPI